MKNYLISKVGTALVWKNALRSESSLIKSHRKTTLIIFHKTISLVYIMDSRSPITEILEENQFWKSLTWCKAVKPSILAVSISAPRFNSLSTSSLSEAAHAAKKTQPSVNWILWDFRFGSEGWVLVSLSLHRFNCSALLNKAEELRFSNEVIFLVVKIDLHNPLLHLRFHGKKFCSSCSFLGTIQKRRTKVKCVCTTKLLLYSGGQLDSSSSTSEKECFEMWRWTNLGQILTNHLMCIDKKLCLSFNISFVYSKRYICKKYKSFCPLPFTNFSSFFHLFLWIKPGST